MTEGDARAYELFVARHPSALLYHSRRYRDLLLELLPCRARYGLAVSGHDILGVFPLMAVDGPFGRVLNSLPFFGSNGGILATEHAAIEALRQWYVRESSASDVAAATVVANPFDPHPTVVPHDAADTRIGMVTTFDPDRDPDPQLMGMIAPSARRNIRKAAQHGVDVSVVHSDLRALEALHRENMAAVGGTPKPPGFFTAVPRIFRPVSDYDLFLASAGDAVAAALLVFYYGSVAEYYMPATKAEYRRLQPMAPLLRAAMTTAIERGFHYWNWGGSWVTQESLLRFKAKWSGQPVTYRYWSKISSPDVLKAEPATLLNAYPSFYVRPFSAQHEQATVPNNG